jgi:hypothetical protein
VRWAGKRTAAQPEPAARGDHARMPGARGARRRRLRVTMILIGGVLAMRYGSVKDAASP